MRPNSSLIGLSVAAAFSSQVLASNTFVAFDHEMQRVLSERPSVGTLPDGRNVNDRTLTDAAVGFSCSWQYAYRQQGKIIPKAVDQERLNQICGQATQAEMETDFASMADTFNKTYAPTQISIEPDFENQTVTETRHLGPSGPYRIAGAYERVWHFGGDDAPKVCVSEWEGYQSDEEPYTRANYGCFTIISGPYSNQMQMHLTGGF